MSDWRLGVGENSDTFLLYRTHCFIIQLCDSPGLGYRSRSSHLEPLFRLNIFSESGDSEVPSYLCTDTSSNYGTGGGGRVT